MPPERTNSSAGGSQATPSSSTPAKAAAAAYTPIYAQRQPIRRSQKACKFCRKSKARCDGPEAWPCRRCRESGVLCEFENMDPAELQQALQSQQAAVDGGPGGDSKPGSPSGPSTSALERRLQLVELELEALKRTSEHHSANLRALGQARPQPAYVAPRSPYSDGGLAGREAGAKLSFDMPDIERRGRKAIDSFWSECAPWAPYIAPATDTYDQLRARSPLLLHCLIAVTARFQDSVQFIEWNEAEAIRLMRLTLYADTPPTLDDLKGTLVWNAWLSRGAPPGHSCTLASQLDLPRSLARLLASMNKSLQESTKAFAELMPLVRAWLSLYAQDLWLSVATGRRSMVTIDFSITSARSLLKFAELRPVDARIIAQCELVTILGGIQESFLKTKDHSLTQTIAIVQTADSHLDNWGKTWNDWSALQESSTGQYMSSSFSMQLYVGRFYINTLGLRDISSQAEVLDEQLPVLKTAIHAAIKIQGVALTYGPERLAHATEFTLISISSAALFLLKMAKLIPSVFDDVAAALAAVRTGSALLSGAPRRQYYIAVFSALQHLEGQLAPFGDDYPAAAGGGTPGPFAPTNGAGTPAAGVGAGANGSGLGGLAEAVLPKGPDTPGYHAAAGGEDGGLGLYDSAGAGELNGEGGELELAISSVVGSDSFWSWTQSLPAESFSNILQTF